MKTTLHMIEISAHKEHKESITLDAAATERIIHIRAEAHAMVRVVCEGTNMSGHLKLAITAAEGATVLVGVACTVVGDNQFTITSEQLHDRPHAQTRLWVRKIVTEHGQALYQGTIYIAPQAQHSVVSQDDKTL